MLVVLLMIGLRVGLLGSPWKDEVIYFIMIDRFANGDWTNDVQTPDGIESGPVNAKYNGGDIAGLIQQLDYIQTLGVTAIWITPPIANQWWDGTVQYGGYHGYWARNFKEIDEHFGDVDLYRSFIEQAHERGIKVVQDIVTNHTGNFHLYDPNTGIYRLNDQSVPTNRPTQFPFDQTDFNDPQQRAYDIYHWEGEIKEPTQYNTPFADLDDLNTSNPIVIDSLKDSYGFWIDLGVDAFRIDTTIYVEDLFWPEFLEGPGGVFERAHSKGTDDFLAFGEAWVTPPPFENSGEQLIQGYFDLGYNAMLDFPLLTDIKRVFKEGRPTEYLSYRLNQRGIWFDNKILVTFIDNHDMDRFLKGATMADLKQALILIFTIPGVPTIYYGTEQGFTETRGAMFAGGYASGESDHYHTDHELYRFIQKIISLRGSIDAFRHGTVTPVHDDPTGPGVFAYTVQDDHDQYVILMNTSIRSKYATKVFLNLPKGTVLAPVFTQGMIDRDLVVDQGGGINLLVNGKATGIFQVTDQVRAVQELDMHVDFEGLVSGKTIADDFVLRGTSHNIARIRLHFDGNEQPYATLVPNEDGTWEVPVFIGDFVAGRHTLFARGFGIRPIDAVYSETYELVFAIPTTQLIQVEDPQGDDRGPTGDYLYPKDVTFNTQMDLRKATLYQIGRMLRMEVQMDNLTDTWSPANGFDHVTFQIFLSNPDKQTGGVHLPKQQAKMPNNLHWNYQIYATGWSIGFFESTGATAHAYGIPVTPTPNVIADKQSKTVTFLIPLEVLETEDLSGWTIYITTYDYDGIEAILRPISPQGGTWTFTGPSTGAPKIMDDLLFVVP